MAHKIRQVIGSSPGWFILGTANEKSPRPFFPGVTEGHDAVHTIL